MKRLLLATLYVIMIPFTLQAAADSDLVGKLQALKEAEGKLIRFIETVTQDTNRQTMQYEKQRSTLETLLANAELDRMLLNQHLEKAWLAKKKKKIRDEMDKHEKEIARAEDELKKLETTKIRIDEQKTKIENAKRILAKLQNSSSG